MSLKDLSEDTFNDIISGCVHSNTGEVSLKTKIYSERSRFVVKAGKEEKILNEFSFFQLLSIEYTTIVNNLSQELDGSLSAVHFDKRHVKIIDKSDESLIHG